MEEEQQTTQSQPKRQDKSIDELPDSAAAKAENWSSSSAKEAGTITKSEERSERGSCVFHYIVTAIVIGCLVLFAPRR